MSHAAAGGGSPLIVRYALQSKESSGLQLTQVPLENENWMRHNVVAR